MISFKKFKGNNIDFLLQGIALSSLTTLTSENKKLMLYKVNSRIKENGKFGNYYFIYNNQNLIGTICLTNKNKIILINDFAIFEKFQNKGLGSNVLFYIKNNYKNFKFKLMVEKRNLKAFHLYQKFGFKIFKEFNNGFILQLDN